MGILASLFKPRSSEIHDLPDRRLMTQAYLPAFAALKGDLLFIGCRGYNRGYYRQLEEKGARAWTTDIDPRSARFGHRKRHRTGDICEAQTLFSDLQFDGVICNGVLGYGVNARDQQVRAIDALAAILKPGGHLLIGWNTDKIEDPIEAGLVEKDFIPAPFAGQDPRVTFAEVTHVYDHLVRRG
ncbi:class I SAM-dependent methyltransferase [Asticcacaulis sp.]|uniref:class I SAM-dependent methyltransferase n=1 Tax=Asticcacaulis sp. TaxID=1872648 RepID=UPI00391B58DE